MHFSPQKHTQRDELYVTLLENITFVEVLCACQCVQWTQDVASSLGAQPTLDFLETERSGDIGRFLNMWPAVSPDLSFLDVWLWNHIKDQAYKRGKYGYGAFPKLPQFLERRRIRGAKRGEDHHQRSLRSVRGSSRCLVESFDK